MGIAIYSGFGALPFPFKAQNLLASDILNTDWEKSCSLFIMPGGRDRPYHRMLQGAGCLRIRRFVENGGTYLGICAGAYFGCAQVLFDIGTPLEVFESRELSFFSGSAVGPAYGKGTFDYFSNRGARAALIQARQNTFYAYYNGGCTFEGAHSSCDVLARFLDLEGTPPAVISCRAGKGVAILSGVHLETRGSTLSLEDPYLSIISLLLTKTEAALKTFWGSLHPLLSQ